MVVEDVAVCVCHVNPPAEAAQQTRRFGSCLCFSACGTLAPGHADQIVARVNIFNYVGSIVGGVAIGGIGTASSLRYGFIVAAVLALALLFLARAFNPSEATP